MVSLVNEGIKEFSVRHYLVLKTYGVLGLFKLYSSVVAELVVILKVATGDDSRSSAGIHNGI
ncbi:hypothetical protein [Spartinivicinus ruber]|uniref:hypothetical protein n=1 Tax=Spartinivicinus ruber TaxID=2683272 RepID=UPI0013D116C8|nr:hypothetical protein [Spartinivicinus ruber]